MTAALFGLLALVPLMVGPLPQGGAVTLTARLCNGGAITIPIPGNEEAPPPCAGKACHAGCNRKRFDPSQ